MKKFINITIMLLVLFLLQGCKSNQGISTTDSNMKAFQTATIPPTTEKSSTTPLSTEKVSETNNLTIKVQKEEVIKLIEIRLSVSSGYAYSIEGYSFDGIDPKTGYYMISWVNPGKGSGAGFDVDPYNGDVYQMGKKTFNLFEVPKGDGNNKQGLLENDLKMLHFWNGSFHKTNVASKMEIVTIGQSKVSFEIDIENGKYHAKGEANFVKDDDGNLFREASYNNDEILFRFSPKYESLWIGIKDHEDYSDQRLWIKENPSQKK